jgi:fibronectin-binding autotransporter adhesin
MRRFACLLWIALLPASALAQSTNWQGGTSNWNSVGNWDNGIPLSSGATAVIDAAGQTITLDVSPSIDSLHLTNGTLTNGSQTLTLAPPNTSVPALAMGAATINLNNDSGTPGTLVFDLSSGSAGSTFTATGTNGSLINVNSGMLALNDNGIGNTLSLSGGGTIALSNNGLTLLPTVISGSSGSETLNTDWNIQGNGQVQLLTLTLSGTMDSNSGGTLTFTPNSGGLTNNGTMQATNGALVIDTGSGGAIVNNGLIRAAGGPVTMSLSAVASLTNNVAGTLSLSGSNMYLAAGDLAVTVTNNGNINVAANGSSATLFVQGTGRPTQLTLGGTGALNLSDEGGNQILGVTGLETLVNGAGHTIQGAGYIGNLSLVNNGTINAGSYGGNVFHNGMAIQANSDGFINNGTVNVGAPGLNVGLANGNLTNSSTGVINVAGGATLGIINFSGLGGVVQNDGAIHLNYDAGAGASGSMTFDSWSGTFTLSGTGSLTMADQANAGSISGVTGFETLVNGAGHSINGAGTINEISFVNNGTLSVTGSNAGLTFTHADFINNGLTSISGPQGLTYSANSVNIFANEGTISVNNSSITFADTPGSGGAVAFNDGTISLTDSKLIFANTTGDTNAYVLSGFGTLSLTSAGGAGSAIVAGGSLGGDSMLVNDVEHTIQGTGVIGATNSVNAPTFGLLNGGTLSATGGALTVTNLLNYNSGSQTLLGGTYISNANSPLIIQNLGPISTLLADVQLNGAGSMLTADGSTDALLSLSELGGSLTLSGGRSLTLSGAPTFSNDGYLRVDSGSVFNTGTASFLSLDSSGVLTGAYRIGGTFQYTPSGGSGYVLSNAGSLRLDGPNSLMTFDGTTDALTQLQSNSGTLSLTGGRSLTLSGVTTFSNTGTIRVDAGSVFNTGATLNELDVNGKLGAGQYDLGGTFQYTPASGQSGYITTIDYNAGITLDGVNSLMTFDGSTDALTQLSLVKGGLTLSGGRVLTLSGISTFTNNGAIEVDGDSVLDTRAGAFGSVDAQGHLTGAYNLAGKLFYTPQSGAAGITALGYNTELLLRGSGQILYGAGAGTNALTTLATNSGLFGMTQGAALTLSGAFTNTFTGEVLLDHASSLNVAGLLENDGIIGLRNIGTSLTAQGYSGNNGELDVLSGATADLRTGTPGGFANLVNRGGVGTLVNGSFVVGGTMRIDGADDGAGGSLGIQAIDWSAALTLSGTGQILYGSGGGTNALAQLSANYGSLTLLNGATLTVPAFTNGAFSTLALNGTGTRMTVAGALSIGTESLVTLSGGAAMQVQGQVVTDGAIVAKGFDTKITGQGLIVTSNGSIELHGGATADFRTGGVDTFANLGGGTVTSGAVLAGGVLQNGAFLIDGQLLYDGTSDGTAGAILAIGANAVVTIVNGGQILTGPNDGVNALANLQENDGLYTLVNTNFATAPATGVFENASGSSLLTQSSLLFVNGDFNNDGNFLLDAGSTAVATGHFTQANGETTVDGEIQASNIGVTGGSVNGTGTLHGSVVQTGGTIEPGDDPGVLTVNGDYTQTAGDLDIEFSGRQTLGSDWSELVVTGTANLLGEIDVTLLNPIGFQQGDRFEILSAGRLIINNDLRFDLPSLGGSLGFVPVFNGTELDLEVENTPEPATWSLLIGAALAGLIYRRKLRVRLLHLK